MTTGREPPQHSQLTEVIGNRLSSVEFVQNYLQLRFDGPCLTCHVWPEVVVGGRPLVMSEPGYRDALCAPIGEEVRAVKETPERIVLSFATGSDFVFRLIRTEKRPPEFLVFESSKGWSYWD